MDDNGGYDIMFPGIYKDYKEGDPQIKADNGLSLEHTDILRVVANKLRMEVYIDIEMGDYRTSKILLKLHEEIEEVIGHPKYYI